ncbi:MAG TPA: Vms1/Ankzf1 family peptidyl-tRNA hydrolase [Vicinamibacteria bacterium]
MARIAVPASLEALVDRLAETAPSALPVLSLYLDARPDARGRDHHGAFVRKALKQRGESYPPRSPERASFERDAENVRAYLRDELDPAANAVAVFAAEASGLFEAVQLEAPIEESRLHVAATPHIYPLARLLDRYPIYAAVVTDTNQARIFVFGLGARLSERTVASPKVTRSEVGGWSQMRYQRHVDDQHRQHVRDVVDALERTVREEGIPHVVLAGDEVVVPLLRDLLPEALATRVVDVVRLDRKAPEREVLEATLEALRRHEAGTEAERAAQLLDEYRAGGLAVAGLRETEAALERGQVHELLLAADPRAVRVVDDDEGSGPPDARPEPSEAGDPAEVSDRLVTRARQTGARVAFVEDAALLESVGGVAAALRYRLRNGAQA